MRTAALLLFVTAALMLCAQPLFADQRADDLLKEARTAIGGDEAIQKIQSLAMKGQYRRVMGDREMSGDREVSIMLPDKYLAEDSFSQGGLSTAIIITRGLNGERAWNASSGGGMGGHGGMVIRMAPGGGSGQQASPEQLEAMYRRSNGLEMSRYLLATLLMSAPSMAVQYTYAGETDVEDTKAEAIDVTGPENFIVRLYFDRATHLPLLLSYRGRKPRMVTMTRSAGDGKAEDTAKKALAEAEKKAADAAVQAKPEEVDFFIRMTEYKKVNGVLLPHKLTFLTETEVSEQFDVAKYQLNPSFKDDKFQKN